VAASLLGAPPREGSYLIFASLAGQPVERLLSPAELRRVAQEVTRRSVPGPRNLATAAVNVLHDMLQKRGPVRSCYVWSERKYGRRGVFLCAPAVLGPLGSPQVIEFNLDPAQQVTMDRSLDFLERLQELRPHF
jgi:malate/lactate dehydrogenase